MPRGLNTTVSSLQHRIRDRIVGRVEEQDKSQIESHTLCRSGKED